MRPIPVNASAAMFFSLLVAFIITRGWPTACSRRSPPRRAHALPETHGTRTAWWIRRLYHATLKTLIAAAGAGVCWVGWLSCYCSVS